MGHYYSGPPCAKTPICNYYSGPPCGDDEKSMKKTGKNSAPSSRGAKWMVPFLGCQITIC